MYKRQVENILDLPIKLKIILDKIINELLKSDLLEKFEELKENNIKLINLYQTDSIYNKLVEDEELTYNTIDNADELLSLIHISFSLNAYSVPLNDCIKALLLYAPFPQTLAATHKATVFPVPVPPQR